MTLTFPDHLTDPREASKRLNSFMSNFLRERIGSFITVRELHESGSWHYHLLVAFQAPICLGFRWKYAKDHKAIPVFKTATKALKTLWRDIREAAPKYGFGRSEILPVRTGKGLAKYFSKVILQRALDPERFKGVRLVSYSRNFLRSVARFAWNNPYTRDFRRKVKRFATELLGITEKLTDEPPDVDWLSYLFPAWFWRYGKVIDGIDRILAQPDLANMYRHTIQPAEF
ncbi:rolling circle replication-associated protein [Desulfobulbus propionicus]